MTWIHTQDYDITPTYIGLLIRGHLVGLEVNADVLGFIWGTHFYGWYWGKL